MQPVLLDHAVSVGGAPPCRKCTPTETPCGLDLIEFRIRNEPEVDPESRLPFWNG